MQNSSVSPKGFFTKYAVSIIIWGLFFIIAILLFADFSKGPIIVSEKVDPYVLSTKGETLILRNNNHTRIKENMQAPIFVGDAIKTSTSTATVFWPDGSITRLGQESSITINEMKAKTANEGIKIDFSLEYGKSWSNVIKYMFGDSYFHERYNNNTALAAVRGTVFEVNLERKYVHTINHAVTISDVGNSTGTTYIVAGDVFDTDTKESVMHSRIDAAWNNINKNADIIYLNEKMEALKKSILNGGIDKNYMDIFLEKIGLKKSKPSLINLISEDKNGWEKFENDIKNGNNSGDLIEIYQQFYGLPNTEKLIDTKIKLRDLIIETATTDKKQIFLDDFARSTLYDSWSIMQSGSGSLEKLEKKLEKYIEQGASRELIENLKGASSNKDLQKINNTLEDIKDSIIQISGQKNVVNEIKKEVNLENLEKINNTATEIRNNITDGLNKFIQ